MEEIQSIDELKENWRNCFIKGLHTQPKTLKRFMEGFNLGIKIYKK